ncbi:MAG TPA: phospho-sugar mutase [Proteobacteria bacterium]|nr:phospho-sugar mutase [Pseudomonadota bacterium]
MKVEQALEIAKGYRDEGRLLDSAYENIVRWLTLPAYREYADEIVSMIENERLKELNDCFFEMIPFGTGGRRGTEGVGPNRINDRTMAESAQGLSEYLLEQPEEFYRRGVVIGYDTRRNSKRYAIRCARVFAGNGIPVYLFDGPRPTPELSFAIRHLNCASGASITASHNPPTDNGFKAYWEGGLQVLSPHDRNIIERVQRVDEIREADFEQAKASGLIKIIGEDVDEPFLDRVCALELTDARDLDFLYTPLHGTGAHLVVPALERMGFKGLKLYEPHMEPDPSFPDVPDNYPNPEEPKVMEFVAARADELGCELAIASDPDADRLGVAVKTGDGWKILSGNQVGVLMCWFILDRLKEAGRLPVNPVVVKTLVTTDMVIPIAESYGGSVVRDLLVGFKYICRTIEDLPSDANFVFAFEESIGYLTGDFVRDKDAVGAAVVCAQMAAHLKARGKSLLDKLDELYLQYGYFSELERSLFFEGAEGHMKMQRIMDAFRSEPPKEIAGYDVLWIIDRRDNTVKDLRTGEVKPYHAHGGWTGNVLVFGLSNDGLTRVTVRPSGTEPKIKHYACSSGRVEDGFTTISGLKAVVDNKVRELMDGILEMERGIAG